MSVILGVETSCDETSAAVVVDGRAIRSNIIASQIDLHRKYGGVYPEIASRQHVLDIVPTVEEALAQAEVHWEQLDAVAVTRGPGLVGSLLVGVNVAKAIAWARGLRLLGVNHLKAHLYANWLVRPQDRLADGALPPPPQFPLICLIVSGGHTQLVWMAGEHDYRVLGQTLDDAAGEAFDKVARLLGLGYPGGPAIQQAAEGGDPTAFDLPRALRDETYDFSFSGLKTAVLRIVQQYEGGGKRPMRARSRQAPSATPTTIPLADLAASFQAAVVDALVDKTKRAAEELDARQVLLAGGVASNSLLREEMSKRLRVPVRCPPPALCTDNGGMIAAAGYFQSFRGEWAAWDMDVDPRLTLENAA